MVPSGSTILFEEDRKTQPELNELKYMTFLEDSNED